MDVPKKAASNMDDKDFKNMSNITVGSCVILLVQIILKTHILDSADSAEAEQIWQSKDVIHGPLQTQKGDVPGENSCPAEVTTEKEKASSSGIVSDEAEDICYLARYFKPEEVKNRCENCSKVAEQLSTNTGKDAPEQTVASTNKNTTAEGDQDSENARKINQDSGKQVKVDHNTVHHVEENQNEQKNANATRLFSKLPPVLIIHFQRSVKELMKVTGHVKFNEILDVGPFMDSSSEDKNNSSYRLGGVIEHLGNSSANEGHFRAYVRPSHQHQSTGSSSWFRANDLDVREVSLDEVLQCEAYILFYERMES